MRTVIDSTVGREIPVSVSLPIQPLTYSVVENGVLVKNRPVVNGHGRQIMDDEWIYVDMPNYGNMSINVNRANYCQKIYLMHASILDSISHEKVTKRLQKFIDEVSSTLVFEKNGKSYRVFLKKTKAGYDLEKVWPYWAVVGTGGIRSAWDSVKKKYGGHPGWDYATGTDYKQPKETWRHNLDVDPKAVFNFEA